MNLIHTVLVLLVSPFMVIVSSKIVRECQDQDLHIECKNGTVINIIDGMYGRTATNICNEYGSDTLNTNCIAANSLHVVQKLCHTFHKCKISPSMFNGDPCVNTYKYLEVNYICVNVGTKVSACENDDLVIPPCPNGAVINIEYAMFGRQNPDVCKQSGFDAKNNCVSQNSTDAVRRMCQYLTTCTITARNSLFGDDPCLYNRKSLEINYSCVDKTEVSIACNTNEMVSVLSPSNEYGCVCQPNYAPDTMTGICIKTSTNQIVPTTPKSPIWSSSGRPTFISSENPTGSSGTPTWSSSGRPTFISSENPTGSSGTPTWSSPGRTTMSSSGRPTMSSSGSPTLNSSGSPAWSSLGNPTWSSSGIPTMSSSGSPTTNSSGSPTLSSSGSPTLSSSGSPTLSSSGIPAMSSPGSPTTILSESTTWSSSGSPPTGSPESTTWSSSQNSSGTPPTSSPESTTWSSSQNSSESTTWSSSGSPPTGSPESTTWSSSQNSSGSSTWSSTRSSTTISSHSSSGNPSESP